MGEVTFPLDYFPGGRSPPINLNPGVPGTPGPPAPIINDIRNAVLNNLISDGQCLSLLGDKGGDVLTTVSTVPISEAPIGNASLGGITNVVPPSIVAQNPFVPMSSQITLNSNGYEFISGVGQAGYYTPQGRLVNTMINSGSPRAIGFVLLHEFGHATGALAPDANNQANENFNNSQVATNCKQTLQGLSNTPVKQ